MRLCFIVIFLFAVLSKGHSQSDRESSKIVVGNLSPNFTLTNIINYKKVQASLSDFKGKYLILDFWGTFCVPCIKLIPKMEDLQKKYGEQLQIMMVATENELKVRNFYKRRKEQGTPMQLPSAMDSIIPSMFGVVALPHYVWIDKNGIIKAVTDYRQVTDKNVLSFIKGENLNLNIKKDTIIAFDAKKPFLINGNGSGSDSINIVFHSVLTRRIPGLRSRYSLVYPGRTTKAFCLNTSIKLLYQMAYGNIPSNKVVLESKDPLKYDYDSKKTDFDTWHLQNTYCYELIVPEEKSKNILDILQNDLKRYIGLSAVFEKRRIKCLILIQTEKGKLQTGGGSPQRKWDATGISIRNKPIKELVDMIQYYLQDRIILDETNYKGNIDIDLDATMYKVDELSVALKKYGLDLIEEEREVDMLILRDNQ